MYVGFGADDLAVDQRSIAVKKHRFYPGHAISFLFGLTFTICFLRKAIDPVAVISAKKVDDLRYPPPILV
jgi:hypothetical protein